MNVYSLGSVRVDGEDQRMTHLSSSEESSKDSHSMDSRLPTTAF